MALIAQPGPCDRHVVHGGACVQWSRRSASMGSIGAAFDNAMAGSFFATSTPN